MVMVSPSRMTRPTLASLVPVEVLITDAMVWLVTKDGGLEVDDDHVVAMTNGGGIRGAAQLVGDKLHQGHVQRHAGVHHGGGGEGETWRWTMTTWWP